MISTPLKNDAYRKARGGPARLLAIHCALCNTHLFRYQKDGPRILKRLYLDRISDPAIHITSDLVCPGCKETLGVPMIYKKESRPAIRLFAGAIGKKIEKK